MPKPKNEISPAEYIELIRRAPRAKAPWRITLRRMEALRYAVSVGESAEPQSEDELHVMVASYLAHHHDARVRRSYSIVNESPRSRAYGRLLQLKGLRQGVSDLFVPVPSGDFHGLYVELKHGKNDCTALQHDFLSGMQKSGYGVAVVHTFDAFVLVLSEYLNDPHAFICAL